MPAMSQNDFQLHVVDALAKLGAQMTTIIGNGQPGRLGELEKTVAEYGQRIERAEGQARLIKWLGAVAGLGGLTKIFFSFLHK